MIPKDQKLFRNVETFSNFEIRKTENKILALTVEKSLETLSVEIYEKMSK